MDSKKINPFRHEYFLGYVNQVLPQYVKVHFPSSVLLNGFTHYGKEFNGGLVGSFVVIEGSKYGFLGRITELLLPESERLSLSEKAFQTSDFHPSGKIEILLSFDLYEPLTVKKGLTTYPNIGAKVFVSSGDLVQEYMSRFGLKNGEKNTQTINLGHLVSSPSIDVKVNLQSIFGRHCAVVGTTGGGKSFTVSKLIEALIETDNKAILIDATGEYNGKYCSIKNVNIGEGESVFHYSQLTIDDLFFMLKPSPRTQTPKLMEAIRSLKISALNKGKKLKHYNDEIVIDEGIIKKVNSPKKPYEVFYYRNISEIENGLADFDFTKLAKQITEECVFDNGNVWGPVSTNDVSYCVSLISRVTNLGNTPELNQVFGFQEDKKDNDITDLIDEFISDGNKDCKLLRLNLKDVKYDFQVRETLVNAVGKYLLNKARNREFENSPVVVLIDEAHQFLNKSIKDEYFESKPLDAFDSIAKECRKYGLFLCIATQMPRDIPKGTLSQMGTFIVHRLINFNDKLNSLQN